MTSDHDVPDEHRLTGGYVGYLDSPIEGQVVRDESLAVRGWVLGNGRAIQRIVVTAQRTMATQAAHQLPRGDVALAHPGHDDGGHSGFEATVDLRGLRSGRLTIRVSVVDSEGRSTAVFTRRVMIDRPGHPSGLDLLRSAFVKMIEALREGRLPTSPRQWVVALKEHFRSPGGAAIVSSTRTDSGDIKTALTTLYMAQLNSFLDTGARLTFPADPRPLVSVVLVLYNRAELTLRCLRSLLEAVSVSIEVILVDNASTDGTAALLARLDNVTILREPENVGFLHGVNHGAALARGKHLLLLNNDTEVLPGALDAAVTCLESDPEVGAVGARLILPDGQLQEAGSIIWRDGSCAGYGRGDTPAAPEYQFRRDVDYCSGAFLLTPLSLFNALGGLDADYQPAYYEEVDYCVRLLRRGLRIVYEPRTVISHFEFASSRSEDAIRLQVERRSLFATKHADWLATQSVPVVTPQIMARSRLTARALRVLYIDDRVPYDHLGSGFPRARLLLKVLTDQGHAVTLYPATQPRDNWAKVYACVPATVEVMLDRGPTGLRAFLDERAGFYDVMIISRPHNLELVRSLYRDADWPPMPLIYDAEAMFSVREAAARRLTGETVPDAEIRAMVATEVALARGSTRVLCVSDQEAAHFVTAGHRTTTLSHAVSGMPTRSAFDSRQGFLFVGAFNADTTPNSDSVLWFIREVLPRIRQRLSREVPITLVGENPTPAIRALSGTGIEVVGSVPDMTPWFDRARVFVAPTRFAAGIPLKILHAAALGVPVVGTSVLQRQLGWTSGVEMLVADDADAFASACIEAHDAQATWELLRRSALARVAADYSADRFASAVELALGTLAPGDGR